MVKIKRAESHKKKPCSRDNYENLKRWKRLHAKYADQHQCCRCLLVNIRRRHFAESLNQDREGILCSRCYYDIKNTGSWVLKVDEPVDDEENTQLPSTENHGVDTKRVEGCCSDCGFKLADLEEIYELDIERLESNMEVEWHCKNLCRFCREDQTTTHHTVHVPQPTADIPVKKAYRRKKPKNLEKLMKDRCPKVDEWRVRALERIKLGHVHHARSLASIPLHQLYHSHNHALYTPIPEEEYLKLSMQDRLRKKKYARSTRFPEAVNGEGVKEFDILEPFFEMKNLFNLDALLDISRNNFMHDERSHILLSSLGALYTAIKDDFLTPLVSEIVKYGSDDIYLDDVNRVIKKLASSEDHPLSETLKPMLEECGTFGKGNDDNYAETENSSIDD